jgi:hypothetical protein
MENIWSEAEIIIKITQTAAIMEVLHVMIGLVKSPWQTAFMQGYLCEWLRFHVFE